MKTSEYIEVGIYSCYNGHTFEKTGIIFSPFAGQICPKCNCVGALQTVTTKKKEIEIP